MPVIPVDDQRFLIDTYSLADRVLKLDNVWTISAGALERDPEGRRSLIATGDAMQVLLDQIAPRVAEVRDICQQVGDGELQNLRDDNAAFNSLVGQGLVSGELGSIRDLYRTALDSLDQLSGELAQEKGILGAKIERLRGGEVLEVGDLRPITRRLLVGLALVAGVALAVAAPHVALVAKAAGLAWRGAKVLCLAVDFVEAVLGQ